MPSERDNRRFVRKAVSVRIRIGDPGAPAAGDGEIFFTSGDLSMGGAFLRSELFFDVGETIELSFALPGTHRISAAGRVVWVSGASEDEPLAEGPRGPGMGIEFTRLEDPDRKVIANFLATQD